MATGNIKESASAVVDFVTGQLDSGGESGSRYPSVLWYLKKKLAEVIVPKLKNGLFAILSYQ